MECGRLIMKFNRLRCTKKIILGCIAAIIALFGIVLVLKYIFYPSETQINKINYENPEFLPNINLKISTEKDLIENQNENSIKFSDCSELYSASDTGIEILYKCEGKLEFCFTNPYGDEEPIKENENVYLKTNWGKYQNITKISCSGKSICQSKKLFNDIERCFSYVINVINQSTCVEYEHSNDTMNDIYDINFICHIMDENRNDICFCIIISFQAIFAPLSCFKNGKDALWIMASNSQIYKMDKIGVHPKINNSSYNIAFGRIKEYFIKSQIAEICPSNQTLSEFGFTYVKRADEVLPEQLQLKSQAQLIRDDQQFKHMLSKTTLAGCSKNGTKNAEKMFGNPLVVRDEITGRVCVMGSKIKEKEHKKEGIVQIFTNLSDNEIKDFINLVLAGEFVH